MTSRGRASAPVPSTSSRSRTSRSSSTTSSRCGARASSRRRSRSTRTRPRSATRSATGRSGGSPCATSTGSPAAASTARWPRRASSWPQEPLLVEPGDILHRELIHPHIAAFAREALDALALRVLPVTGATRGRGDGRRVSLQPARRRDAPRRPRGRRSVPRRAAPGRPRAGRDDRRLHAVPRRPGPAARGQPEDARAAEDRHRARAAAVVRDPGARCSSTPPPSSITR